jgi:malate dehydrogenase (oxaloacetate-decarboxylating)(NADP+)
MLSFSNFGYTCHPDAIRVENAMELFRKNNPDLIIDGEMQADSAVSEEILNLLYPLNRLGSPTNVLIFPNLDTGNSEYKLLNWRGGAKAVGPYLMGISKPFNVMQRDTDMENVVNVIAFTVIQSR